MLGLSYTYVRGEVSHLTCRLIMIVSNCLDTHRKMWRIIYVPVCNAAERVQSCVGTQQRMLLLEQN